MADPVTNTVVTTQGLIERLVPDPLLQFAAKIVLGVALLLIGLRAGRWLANIGQRVLLRAHVDVILAEFLRNIAYATCVVVLLFSALEVSGFPVTTLVTVLGTAGIAIGLALKDSLAHTAAGVVLIVLRPFRVGDKVNIANQEGVVEGVFIFQTRLHAADNRDIVLMNGAVLGAPIVNYSQRALRRADIALLLRCDGDLRPALDVAREVAAADARIEKDPPPSATITDISDRGAALALNVWCKSADVDAVRTDLLLHLHEAYSRRGIALAQATPLPAPGKTH
ncbi:MAG: mechanosensitive ion channel [Lysobacter sp.]|nr:mechanosensitive ion channel [Lysobacter sp.]